MANTRIDELTVDVTLSERHGSRVAVTQHPIESGMNPIDHARVEPDSYTIEGIFSNFPLPAGRGKVALDATDTYAKKQATKLWALKDARRAISIATDLKTYDNMVLTSLDMPRDPALGQDVQFTATFTQVRFVNVEMVALTNPPTKVATKPTSKTKQSKQVPTPASDTDKTWAAGLDSSVGNAISNFATGN